MIKIKWISTICEKKNGKFNLSADDTYLETVKVSRWKSIPDSDRCEHGKCNLTFGCQWSSFTLYLGYQDTVDLVLLVLMGSGTHIYYWWQLWVKSHFLNTLFPPRLCSSCLCSPCHIVSKGSCTLVKTNRRIAVRISSTMFAFYETITEFLAQGYFNQFSREHWYWRDVMNSQPLPPKSSAVFNELTFCTKTITMHSIDN